MEKPIYGAEWLAEIMGVSDSTIWRWVKHPLNDFMQVGSMDNSGGGQGRALWTYPSSLQAFRERMTVETSEKRRQAAMVRWTDQSGGSAISANPTRSAVAKE